MSKGNRCEWERLWILCHVSDQGQIEQVFPIPQVLAGILCGEKETYHQHSMTYSSTPGGKGSFIRLLHEANV